MTLDEKVQDLEIKTARLQEKLEAAATAVELARKALDTYQQAGETWRQVINDQRSQFVTMDRAIALITFGVGVAVSIAKLLIK